MPQEVNTIEALLGAPTHWSMRYGSILMLLFLVLLILTTNLVTLKETKSLKGSVRAVIKDTVLIQAPDANFLEIKNNEKVNISISAYDPKTYGFIEGTLISVDSAHSSFQIKMSETLKTSKGYTIPINAGYSCEVIISLGVRTLFQKIVN
jgi:hypothetical protein